MIGLPSESGSTRNLSVFALMAVVVASGCASSGSGAAPTTAPDPEPVPRPFGEDYLVYFVEADSLRVHDTRDGSRRALLQVEEVLLHTVSPNRHNLAIAAVQGSASTLAVIDLRTGTIQSLHTGSSTASYSAGWNAQGDLGFGYSATDAEGRIALVSAAGTVTEVGCSVSDRFVSWRQDGTLVVTNGQNMYTVRAQGCTTVATFPMSGKTEMTYSPNGEQVAFLRSRTIPTQSGGRVSRRELHLSAYNGANARLIADYQTDPTQLTWSPAGNRIAFEMRSPQYADITHVGIYDGATNQVTFRAQPETLGMPSDSDVRWSPTGTRMAHRRMFRRSGAQQAYRTVQTVVRDPGNVSGSVRVVSEDIVTATAPDLNDTWGWIDSDRLLVSTSQGWVLSRLDAAQPFRLPVEGLVVAVYVLRGP